MPLVVDERTGARLLFKFDRGLRAEPARTKANAYEIRGFTAQGSDRSSFGQTRLSIWHGYTTVENAPIYESLLKSEIFHGIERKKLDGFRGIDLIRRRVGDEEEFITIMRFESIEKIKAFTGEDYESAYVPQEARKVLKRYDERS